MLAKVSTASVLGLEAAIVQVEVDIAPGMPSFTLVGLPDATVQESKERVRAAIRNSGGSFPVRRLTINLSPADLRKEGPSYDLPIAIGVLAATGGLSIDESQLFVGELSLDGQLRHTNGILPIAALARSRGVETLFVPRVNAREAALVPGLTVIPVEALSHVVGHLTGGMPIQPQAHESIESMVEDFAEATDFSEIKGQEHAKRALEIAAAGGHNLIMTGPPGSGKTLLARALSSILPGLSLDEALEVTRVYSVSGLLHADRPLIRQRPFRSPHHTSSYAALVGGGRSPRPGEVSLAHRGVLFLDELPEFQSNALEALRQPLEDKLITISRVQGAVEYPANVMLIAAMNPCPCGHLGDPGRTCICPPSSIAKYQKRISGPLLDRIDIHIEVPRIEYEKLADRRLGEPSAAIRPRVEAARTVQRQRFTGTSLACNADMGPAEIRQFCLTDDGAASLLKSAVSRLQLSGRGYHRMLKLARTIADLAGDDLIAASHVAEAVQYRPRLSSV